MNVRAIDHIAIAVWSIPDALSLFRDILGAKFITGGDDEERGIRILQLSFPPGVKIELMEPLNQESFLHRDLEMRGEGFHHLTLFFDDLEPVIENLPTQGIEIAGTDLRSPGWRETFIRPSSGFGTLLQLTDTTLDWCEPAPGITAEDVVNGRVVWRDNRPHLKNEPV
jgi:methylmalonyl-CoA/ethylmalonyl-CoA epimerase